MKRKFDLDMIILYIIVVCLAWISITSIIQSFMCPDMTEMRVFLRAFHSFVLDFKHCN